MTRACNLRSPGVGGRDRSRLASRWRLRSRSAIVAVPLALAACAQQAESAVAPAAPGFLLGLWHGFIFPLAWIISLFDSDVAIYAVPNNGGWYDFGYFFGIVFLGVGARKGTRVVYRDRNVIDVKAKHIGGGDA